MVRVVKPFLSQGALKIMYFAFFQSVMTYGIIFWGNSTHTVIIFLDYKKELIELQWETEQETRVENF
jgi:hypothetical protein